MMVPVKGTYWEGEARCRSCSLSRERVSRCRSGVRLSLSGLSRNFVLSHLEGMVVVGERATASKGSHQLRNPSRCFGCFFRAGGGGNGVFVGGSLCDCSARRTRVHILPAAAGGSADEAYGTC